RCARARSGRDFAPSSSTRPSSRRNSRGRWGSERHDRPDRDPGQSGTAAAEPEPHDDRRPDHAAAQPLDAPSGRGGGAARRKEVVDQENTIAGPYGVFVGLERVHAILEGVFDADGTVRQLPGLPNRNEPRAKADREWRREDEAAGL